MPAPTTISFTSARTAAAMGGTPFAYAITYQNAGNPAQFRDSVLSKPSWVAIQNDTIRGIAPNVNRTDTVRVTISSGTDSDTLILKIRIAYSTAIIRGFSSAEQYFGKIKGSQIGINTGAYEISVYAPSGRGVFHQKASARSGYVPMDLATNTGNVFVVKLTQGNRSMVNTMHVVR